MDAQECLTISHSESRKKYGQAMPCHPSLFLKEIPDELIEHANERSKQPVAAESGKSMFDMMRAALEQQDGRCAFPVQLHWSVITRTSVVDCSSKHEHK